jgi:hypothetical protein
MSHIRLIALVALLVTLAPAPPLGGGGAPGHLVADETEALSHTVRELPRTLHPWYADYPASIEIDGATVRAETPSQVDDMIWALDRYETAGIDLPHVQAWLHDRRAGCNGPARKGRAGFATWRNDQAVVFACAERDTLLHELGHVYDRHALTDDDRNAFMELRGVDEWHDPTWLEAGEEHLADVLTWGLDDGRPNVRTMPRDEDALVAAFTRATGVDPLRQAPAGHGSKTVRHDASHDEVHRGHVADLTRLAPSLVGPSDVAGNDDLPDRPRAVTDLPPASSWGCTPTVESGYPPMV